MKIKRYLDKDMRQVLRRVRESQGPDAVILSNRRVAEGIEVIAAIDYDEAMMRQALGVVPDSSEPICIDALAGIAEDEVTHLEELASPVPEIISAKLDYRRIEAEEGQLIAGSPGQKPEEDLLQNMHSEIASLRGLLETQVSGLVWNNMSKQFPLRAQVLRNLARIGLAPDISNMVVNRLGPLEKMRHVWRSPLGELAQMVPVKDDNLMQNGGVISLIGPTGVGKTTTIAKIAAQFATHHHADDIGLISADSYRIGAKEHLMAFANIIGATVHSANSSAELTETLDRLRDKKLVLIDTEGRSQRDRDLAGRLAAYGSNQDRVKFYLTLSAATQESALDETLRQFNQVPLEGCIVTKIDEAGQLGCVMSSLIRHDLPAAWFSDGQRIPEDLHSAGRKKLWLVNQAVECMENSQPKINERTMAENYSRASMANA